MNDEVKQVFDALAALGWHVAAMEETTAPNGLFHQAEKVIDNGHKPIVFVGDVPALKLTLTRKAHS